MCPPLSRPPPLPLPLPLLLLRRPLRWMAPRVAEPALGARVCVAVVVVGGGRSTMKIPWMWEAPRALRKGTKEASGATGERGREMAETGETAAREKEKEDCLAWQALLQEAVALATRTMLRPWLGGRHRLPLYSRWAPPPLLLPPSPPLPLRGGRWGRGRGLFRGAPLMVLDGGGEEKKKEKEPMRVGTMGVTTENGAARHRIAYAVSTVRAGRTAGA